MPQQRAPRSPCCSLTASTRTSGTCTRLRGSAFQSWRARRRTARSKRSGKTTTMRMILGILTPDGGTISWNGAPLDVRTRDRFGYLPEERGLYGKMRVRDHITYFGRLRGIGKSDMSRWTAEWIERLELQQYADRPCAELSKGTNKRCRSRARPCTVQRFSFWTSHSPGSTRQRRTDAFGPARVAR